LNNVDKYVNKHCCMIGGPRSCKASHHDDWIGC
jgi:hypothetical protein